MEHVCAASVLWNSSTASISQASTHVVCMPACTSAHLHSERQAADQYAMYGCSYWRQGGRKGEEKWERWRRRGDRRGTERGWQEQWAGGALSTSEYTRVTSTWQITDIIMPMHLHMCPCMHVHTQAYTHTPTHYTTHTQTCATHVTQLSHASHKHHPMWIK